MTTANSLLRQQIIEEARRWIGTPYHHQASLRGVGCDCAGLHRGVAKALGIPWTAAPEPQATILLASDWFFHTTREYFRDVFAQTLAPVALEAIDYGDTLLFGWPGKPCSHAAIVVTITPQVRFVHAPFRRKVLDDVLTPTWKDLLRCAFSAPAIAEDPCTRSS